MVAVAVSVPTTVVGEEIVEVDSPVPEAAVVAVADVVVAAVVSVRMPVVWEEDVGAASSPAVSA